MKKFIPRHHCKKQTLFLLEWEDCEEENFELPEMEVQSKELAECQTISLHVLTGSKAPKTLRVAGFIKWQLVSILIDSDNTHNFINEFITK